MSFSVQKNRKVLIGLSAVLVILIGALLFYFLYWIKTPAYSLGLVQKSIEKHDLPTFKRHVDLKSLYSRGFDDLMQESLGEDASNGFVAGIVAALKENIIQTMITETEKYVETGNFEKPAQSDGKSQASIQDVSQKLDAPNLEYAGVKGTQIDGNIAIVTLSLRDTKVDKEFDLKIKMRAIDNGEWQVVEVTNLIEFMQEQEKAEQEKLAEINAPVQKEMDAAFDVSNRIAGSIVSQNSFFPSHYIRFQIGYTLPTPDKKVSSVMGYLNVKDKDGKTAVTLPVQINNIDKNYTAADYTTDKIWTFESESEDSLNPFLAQKIQKEYIPRPYFSALSEECLQSGKDLVDGGAKYNIGPVLTGIGLAESANSLAAIKKLVFDDHVCTLQDLLEACDNNWDGYEELRKRAQACPKYGNDDDYVDDIAKRIENHYYEETVKYKDFYGHPFTTAFMGISNFIPTGRVLGASACGRKATEPISEGISPVGGTDTATPLAAMKSCAKMNQDIHSGGTLLNMRLSHDLVATKRGRSNLAAVVQSFFDLGAFHIQFNTLSTETLLDAQKHPENYKDLLVRVAGYSTQFVHLSKRLQDSIIRRSVHDSF